MASPPSPSEDPLFFHSNSPEAPGAHVTNEEGVFLLLIQEASSQKLRMRERRVSGYFSTDLPGKLEPSLHTDFR